MGTSFQGTFVIHWAQTKVDGQKAAPLHELLPGYPWEWTGDALRVDGPESVLPLAASADEIDLRTRAAASARRFLSGTLALEPKITLATDDPVFKKHFTLTDGLRAWQVFVLSTHPSRPPLLMFYGDIPPRNTELWIVKHNLDQATACPSDEPQKNVICFTPGTMIRTPDGARDVASLGAGDRVQTYDNGVAEILWMGTQRVSGARLRAMPELSPIRFKAGALAKDVPDEGLLVSPDHRVVLTGPRARALFSCEEVLVAAKDLINDHNIVRDHTVGSVSYIHMLFEHHEIVFANGVATESFHPAHASLESLTVTEKSELFSRMPDLGGDIGCYGGFARRLLDRSGVAILQADI